MKILITGGMGFIGVNLANYLGMQGHEVILVDYKKVDASYRPIPKLETYWCDITDFDQLNEISTTNCDIVLHLAGQPSAAMSFEEPQLDMRLNVLSTLNMLKWCQKNNVSRLIYASTFNVYQEQRDKEFYKETYACEPKSPYSLSKYSAEQYIRLLGPRYGVDWNIMRMFNVYGPGQDPTNKYLGMVNIFMNMVKNTNYIGVKGSLNRFRDFVFIDDVVEAWASCIENKNSVNKVFNVGSGQKVTVRELIDSLILVYDKTNLVTVEELEGTPGDFLGSVADLTEIKQALSYSPKVNIQEGLARFKKWACALDKY